MWRFPSPSLAALALLANLHRPPLLSQAPPPVPADAPYKNAATPVEERVKDLLGRMTLEEKASMLAGSGWMESMPIERLGIPAIKMADGPMGVRAWLGSSAVTNAANAPRIESTSFPSGVAMAATWDTDLVEREGHAIGQEVKALGRDMILGPTVNINRVPLWGRNFEGYGEDPYLAGRLAVAYIKGVQGEGVIPSVKHFAANNQEFERHRIDEHIDARTLHEIYFARLQGRRSGRRRLGGDVRVPEGERNLLRREPAPAPGGTLTSDFGFKGFVDLRLGQHLFDRPHRQRRHGPGNARRTAG